MRHTFVAFLLGIVATLALAALTLFVIIKEGWVPANADTKPPALERWAATTALRAMLRREASTAAPPIPADDPHLRAGALLYAANCAVCHGASRGAPTAIARGLYQAAPQFRDDGVEDDPPGRIFWKVDHGIRFTAMPAFSRALTETQVWEVTLFLKHLDHLPSGAAAEWQRIRS